MKVHMYFTEFDALLPRGMHVAVSWIPAVVFLQNELSDLGEDILVVYPSRLFHFKKWRVRVAKKSKHNSDVRCLA